MTIVLGGGHAAVLQPAQVLGSGGGELDLPASAEHLPEVVAPADLAAASKTEQAPASQGVTGRLPDSMAPLLPLVGVRYRALSHTERVVLAVVEELGPDGGALDRAEVAARLPRRGRRTMRRLINAALTELVRVGLVEPVGSDGTTVVAVVRRGGERRSGEVAA